VHLRCAPFLAGPRRQHSDRSGRDVFGPAVAALTLASSASKTCAAHGPQLCLRSCGDVAIAALAGAVGWMFSQRAVFLLVPVFAVLATAAALSIPAAAIDQRRARGAAREDQEGERANDVASMSVLLECRPLVIFGCCALLFHFANAPLLPLVVRSSPSRTGMGDGP